MSSKTVTALLAALTLTVASACAQQPPGTAPSPINAAAVANTPLTPSSSVDDLLDALDVVGRDLRDFTANVTLTETDTASADSSTHGGQVWYLRDGDNGQAQMRVIFDKPAQAKIEYMLDNGWLIDRDYRRHIEVDRQVLKPGEKINLLKLGEGPFPLPIGQSKEDVHKLFGVAKIEPKKDDPADTVHLQLTPNPATQFERKFSSIDVWVDTKTHFPRRIQTLDKNQTTDRTVDFDAVRFNGAVKPSDLTLPKIDESQWQVHREPYSG